MQPTQSTSGTIEDASDVPIAFAKPWAVQPISTDALANLCAPYASKTVGEMFQGPGWISETGIPCVVLRPTLMFGWFDRKHLGWLSRFMSAGFPTGNDNAASARTDSARAS